MSSHLPHPLYRTPQRVSLAYQALTSPPSDLLTQDCGSSVLDLDLSHNRISDLKFLSELPCLKSLVLDHNRISSHVKMTSCPSLETLWANNNRIENLGLFISTLTKNCPNLRILSMMNNVAAPSYFNGGTYQQFQDYRYFVISHMTKLKVLDDTKITPEEVSEANRLYPVTLVKAKRRPRSSRKKREERDTISHDQ